MSSNIAHPNTHKTQQKASMALHEVEIERMACSMKNSSWYWSNFDSFDFVGEPFTLAAFSRVYGVVPDVRSRANFWSVESENFMGAEILQELPTKTYSDRRRLLKCLILTDVALQHRNLGFFKEFSICDYHKWTQFHKLERSLCLPTSAALKDAATSVEPSTPPTKVLRSAVAQVSPVVEAIDTEEKVRVKEILKHRDQLVCQQMEWTFLLIKNVEPGRESIVQDIQGHYNALVQTDGSTVTRLYLKETLLFNLLKQAQNYLIQEHNRFYEKYMPVDNGVAFWSEQQLNELFDT